MSLMTYVGSLPSSAIQIRLPLLCAPHGTIKSAYIITSKITSQPFGYGSDPERRLGKL
jgi:hypothetical protein